MESDFEVERIISISLHWGWPFQKLWFPIIACCQHVLVNLPSSFWFYCAFPPGSLGLQRAARKSWFCALSTGFGEEGQQNLSTLWEADGLGKGRVAWPNTGMLMFGFNLPHNPASLFLCWPRLAGKICSNFAQWGEHSTSLGLQLAWIFMNSSIWI